MVASSHKHVDPYEIQKIEYIRQHFIETANTFGFDLMEPSPIELMSVIEAKSGPTIRDDVYFFNDKGDREVSLRFDFPVNPAGRLPPALPCWVHKLPATVIRWYYWTNNWSFRTVFRPAGVSFSLPKMIIRACKR